LLTKKSDMACQIWKNVSWENIKIYQKYKHFSQDKTQQLLKIWESVFCSVFA